MNLQGFLHAEKGTRTLTGLLPLEPESSASAIPPFPLDKKYLTIV